MQKWEYATEAIWVEKEDAICRFAFAKEEIMKLLTRAGEAEWELVSVIPIIGKVNGKTTELVYTFKRPM